VNPLILALVAGTAMAVQNLLLSVMVSRGLAYPAVLFMNSAVGLLLLLAVCLVFQGPALLREMLDVWKPWYLVPGLLGTFAVFALVFGYTHVGAPAPTIALIAGQVLASILMDCIR
jgi:transporter family-2 protein